MGGVEGGVGAVGFRGRWIQSAVGSEGGRFRGGVG